MKALTRSFNIALPATLLPLLFIVMWSSGYVVGKVALPFVGPYTLIFIRFASAALILLGVALATKAPWPKTRAQFGHLVVVGILIQALQFAGLYMGLDLGVSAAVAALIVGTMPVFTALGATRFLNEKVSRVEWLGLVGGYGNGGLLVVHKISIRNRGGKVNDMGLPQYSEMHNKVLRRCCASSYYLYCLRLRALYLILHSTI